MDQAPKKQRLGEIESPVFAARLQDDVNHNETIDYLKPHGKSAELYKKDAVADKADKDKNRTCSPSRDQN